MHDCRGRYKKMTKVTLKGNRISHQVIVEPTQSMFDLLRKDLRLIGWKQASDRKGKMWCIRRQCERQRNLILLDQNDQTGCAWSHHRWIDDNLIQSMATITLEALMTAYTFLPLERCMVWADFFVMIETTWMPPGSSIVISELTEPCLIAFALPPRTLRAQHGHPSHQCTNARVGQMLSSPAASRVHRHSRIGGLAIQILG